MHRLLLWTLIVGSSVSCSTTWQRFWNEVFADNAAVDKRTYRAFTLPNKLQILLIHDPQAKKSAAAMDVNVGSLADPWEHQGLAHFLEHMLFLGTSKYPEVGEYNRYLASHQGYSNAYTAGEHTNYHFEVGHDGFRGALDRFSQFFISPLFNQEFVEREMNAVNSEHQKNLQDDYWRSRMVNRLLHKQGHPRQKFSTGDLATLKNSTNEVLINFYNQHYSANLMRLAILSRLSLDEQERLVTALFSEVKNHNRVKLAYDTVIYDTRLLPQRIEIEPVTDIKYLELSFAVPSTDAYWKSKTTNLLASLIGDEGKGSLLSLLKAKGYATSLSSWVYPTSYAGEFQTQITLTEQGLTAVNEVISIFFSYLAMLKKNSLQGYYFAENKNMAQISYDYRDPLEGADAVVSYASLMHLHPPLDVLKNRSLYFVFSPADFDLFLGHMTPEKLRATLVAKGVKTDKIEKHYGTSYSVRSIPKQVYQAWQNPKVHAQLHYPQPNVFIPENLDVLADDRRDEPFKLLADERGAFWFQQDTDFLLPKAQLYLNILTAKVNSNPREKLLSILYVQSLRESINEWRYPIAMAGLSFGIDRNDFGISIDIKGYSDKIPLLLGEIRQKLKTVTIGEKTFAALKDKLKRDLANLSYQQAYRQVISKGDVILSPVAIDYPDYMHLVDSVSLTEVGDYAQTQVFRDIAYEGVAYGNLDHKTLATELTALIAKLKAGMLPLDERRQEQILKLDKKYNYSYTTASNNHALTRIILLGERTPRLDALLRIITTHIEAPFYTELRTRQQLGYVVFSGGYYRQKVLGLRFIIQSASYNPKEIDARITNFISTMSPQFVALTPEKLDEYRRSITKKLEEPEKNIYERHARLKAEALKLNGDFRYRQKVIAALRSVTKKEIVATWKRLKTAGQLYVSLFARDKALEISPGVANIDDPEKFKRSLPVW